MTESPLCFHHVEWPAPGARVAGPVVWLRGWVVGKPGHDLIDVRARTAAGVFLGVLGLPRTDLAAHFAPTRAWLPAEFIIAVSAPDGALHVSLEAQEARGNWVPLQTLDLVIAADGSANPRTEGELVLHAGGGAVTRVPHLPLHGHLDDPVAEPEVRDGALSVFGWFVHDQRRIARVLATLDGRTFSVLASGLTDDVLAQKVPHLPAARHGRVRGTVPFFATHFAPACLRVYVELDDSSVQLALARRIRPRETPAAPTAEISSLAQAEFPPLPSGRPRRLLIVVRTMRPDDETLRALDVARHLRESGRWVARVIAAEDGAVRARFEASDCAVQLVDLRKLTAATGIARTAELARLEREIWWRHLDAVALFDPTSEWLAPLAARHGLPVFRDPAARLAWFAPDERLTHDPAAPLLAPIRGLARHGAATLLGAMADLAQPPAMIVSDVRDKEEEHLFRAALAFAPSIRADPAPSACAAVVCPAWRDHPVRTLLTAAASGVPIITTPAPQLAATFAHGEMIFFAPDNPLALAHAVLDLQANPSAALRRADAARRVVRAAHDPAKQLPRWVAALEAAVVK